MIQVDVFWSFAMGATLAVSASERLKSEKSLIVNQYFIFTVLYLSLIFAPSGAYLLWEHTAWETMFFYSPDEIHGLATCLFSLTNVLLGVLGFVLVSYLSRAGLAGQVTLHTLWTLPYTCMFSILTFGYDRFLYAGTLEEFRKGLKYPITDFFTTQVFLTLLVMGIFVLPPLFYANTQWPKGSHMTVERRWENLGQAMTSYYRITGLVVTIYVILWKVTSSLPIGWGADRLFAFLIGQVVFGIAIFSPLGLIPVSGDKKVKFRRD